MKRNGLLPVAIVIVALIACGVLNKLDEQLASDGSKLNSAFAYEKIEWWLDR